MFQPHSQTSPEAYEKLTDESTQIEEVLKAFRAAGPNGATCEEAHKALQATYRHWITRPYGSVSARMTTLKERGEILYTGETRKTTSGRNAEVWLYKGYADPNHFQLTADKQKSDRQTAIENIENVGRFLESLAKSNTLSPAWSGALRHNKELIEAAKKLLT